MQYASIKQHSVKQLPKHLQKHFQEAKIWQKIQLQTNLTVTILQTIHQITHQKIIFQTMDPASPPAILQTAIPAHPLLKTAPLTKQITAVILIN